MKRLKIRGSSNSKKKRLNFKNEITGKVILSLIYVMLGNELQAQSGEDHSFSFIDVPQSPRVTGMGGVNVSLTDVNMFMSNPGALDSSLSSQVSINHYFYYADIQYNSVALVQQFGKTGTWGLGLQQAGYGSIDTYDQSGNSTGESQAGEYAIILGKGIKKGNFTIGANLKFASSDIASYRASAIMTDLGIIFKHPKEDLSIGFTIHNLGWVIRDYTESSNSTLPFDVRAGISYKPIHMPFRFSMTLQHLTQGNIIYDNSQLYSNQAEAGKFDKVFSHVVLATELVLNKNLSFFGGYNHLIRKELSLQQVSGGAGFSYGLLLSIKAFSLSYAAAFYHVTGGTHHVGLSVNLTSLYKRIKIH